MTEQITLDLESERWLEADLGENLPEYDWGEPGIPEDKPIRYEPGTGFIVELNTRVSTNRENQIGHGKDFRSD